MNELQKRTWAEISTANILYNYRAIRAALPAGCRFMGIVKADAYGHGAMVVAKLLQEAGAEYLAVSCLDEALELRRGGISMPILILGHTPEEYTGQLIDSGLTQTVTCLAKALEYSARACALGGTLKVHMKIDTGMSRLGFLCAGPYFDEGVDNLISACRLPGLDAEGIYTHFSSSDTDDGDSREYTRSQFELFMRLIGEAKRRGGVEFPLRHCANSGAVINHPDTALDMVRPGLLLYGYGDGDGGRLGLRPCMRLVTTVSTIKFYEPGTYVSYGRRFVTRQRSRIGVLAVGYADGLLRAMSNKCSFAAPGGRVPQVGAICMDMCMADLTGLPQVEVGSEIELFGGENSLEELAGAAGTIPYELLCSVSKRVPRVYK